MQHPFRKDKDSAAAPKQVIAYLFNSAANGDTPAVLEWIETHGAKHINEKDFYSWTALMQAAREGRKETVELLLQHGADPFIKNDSGFDAAHYARKMNYTEVVDLLEAWTENTKKQQADATEKERKEKMQAQIATLREKAKKFKLK